MRKTLLWIVLFPCMAFGVERQEVLTAVVLGAKKTKSEYMEARDKIVSLGTDVLPVLGELAVDSSATWQERLVGRVWYERIARKVEIDALRNLDWRQQEGYDRKWEWSMVGPGPFMTKVVASELERQGLWYYYLERIWKDTEEGSLTRLQNINTFWTGWCNLALKEQPERYYLTKTMIEYLERDMNLDDRRFSVYFYKELRDAKESDAVPILVERYDAFNKREVIGPEMFAGRHAELYCGMFEPILQFADSRHADLLEQFVATRPTLAPLKEKVAEIRNRPAPEPKPEPPFRLNTTLAYFQRTDSASSPAVAKEPRVTALPTPTSSTVAVPEMIPHVTVTATKTPTGNQEPALPPEPDTSASPISGLWLAVAVGAVAAVGVGLWTIRRR